MKQFSAFLPLALALFGLGSQTSCQSGGASDSGSTLGGAASTSRSDYPFDENGNYRPDFLAQHGGGQQVIDLTKDNKRSPFLDTASDNGWSVASNDKPKKSTSTSSSSSKPPTKSSSRTVASAKPKTPSKPVSKPAAKPKPSYGSHTVVKGDTLYGLSRRYGVSEQAIKSANGLSGTVLGLGKTLKIPRK